MKESMLEAIPEKDREKLMELVEKTIGEISRAAMPSSSRAIFLL